MFVFYLFLYLHLDDAVLLHHNHSSSKSSLHFAHLLVLKDLNFPMEGERSNTSPETTEQKDGCLFIYIYTHTFETQTAALIPTCILLVLDVGARRRGAVKAGLN